MLLFPPSFLRGEIVSDAPLLLFMGLSVQVTGEDPGKTGDSSVLQEEPGVLSNGRGWEAFYRKGGCRTGRERKESTSGNNTGSREGFALHSPSLRPIRHF